MLGTEEGRECYAGLLTEGLVAEFPEGSEVEAALEESVPAGADVGVQIVLGYDVTGVTGFITLDQFGVLCGDTTFVVSGVNSSELPPTEDPTEASQIPLSCDFR